MIRDYVKEIVKIIRSTKDADKLKGLLSDYHEKDIAEAITQLSGQERAKLYNILDIQTVAEIFSYIDDVQKYLAWNWKLSCEPTRRHCCELSPLPA